MILTAKEFLWNNILTQGDIEPYGHIPKIKIYEAMLEFAKLHVQEALKQASEKVQITDFGYAINKDSILNAYNLDDIK